MPVRARIVVESVPIKPEPWATRSAANPGMIFQGGGGRCSGYCSLYLSLATEGRILEKRIVLGQEKLVGGIYLY